MAARTYCHKAVRRKFWKLSEVLDPDQWIAPLLFRVSSVQFRAFNPVRSISLHLLQLNLHSSSLSGIASFRTEMESCCFTCSGCTWWFKSVSGTFYTVNWHCQNEWCHFWDTFSAELDFRPGVSAQGSFKPVTKFITKYKNCLWERDKWKQSWCRK